jgi:Rrf2 family iron-sulfur cluster assembly transcriptional regulator
VLISLPSVYAIRALAFLADQAPGKLSGTRDIAEREDIPAPFLSKVLLQLRRGRLVRSYRGTGGGYELAAPAETIHLLSILQCMEGPAVLKQCVLEGRDCSPECPCALHHYWVPVQGRMLEFFESNTLAELVRARHNTPGSGEPFRARRDGPVDQQIRRSGNVIEVH